jgi:hypothetical protein
MEVSGHVHAPAALPAAKSPWYPLDRRIERRRSGRDAEEKNSQPLPGLEPPVIQPVYICSSFLCRITKQISSTSKVRHVY